MLHDQTLVSPQISTHSARSSFVWWLVFFFAAIGAIAVLNQDFKQDPHFPFLLYPLLPLTLIALAKASARSSILPRLLRIFHWAMALGLLLLLGLHIAGQWNPIRTSYKDGSPFYLAIVATIVISGFLWIRRDRSASRQWRRQLTDIIGGFGALTSLLMALLILMNIRASQRENDANQRWASIHRPMSEFGKQFIHTDENESLRLLAADLAPFKALVYKRQDGEPERELDQLTGPDDLYQMTEQIGDTVSGSEKVTQFLTNHRATLDQLYRDVLAHEPAIWTLDPEKWPSMRVPNFLVLRKLSQVINADVLEQIRLGKDEEASRALTAGLRTSQGLHENPLLVSTMIRVAVECLFAKAYVRIQEDQVQKFEVLAGSDAETLRESLRKCLQAEAWSYGHYLNRVDTDFGAAIIQTQVNAVLPQFGKIHPGFSEKPFRHLPSWLARPLVRIDQANNSICMAEFVRTTLDPANLSEPAFSMNIVDEFWSKYPSVAFPNFSRAWGRLNASLLLREQADLIRQLRKEWRAGKASENGELASQVLPGNKWSYRLDSERGTVTTKLQTISRLLTEVTSDEFFLIPINGSAEWIFARHGSHANASTAPVDSQTTALR